MPARPTPCSNTRAKLRWLDTWPEAIEGVVVGNEVLDAMPVQLLQRTQGIWHERGVVSAGEAFAWQDRITDWRPSVEIEGEHDYLTEIHPQAEAFVTSLAERLLAGRGGAAFLLDYGFPEAEYFHPQRHMGTVMCHQLTRPTTTPWWRWAKKTSPHTSISRVWPWPGKTPV